MIVYLIGYMGSGKSRYGRAAASILGWQFLDLDRLIENHSGMVIPEIFEHQGENRFRELEQETLFATLPVENTIIATGGGTPCTAGNIAFMKQHGQVVYLCLHPKSLIDRLKLRIEGRPVLMRHAADPEGFITQHLTEREPWYLQAHRTVKGEGLTGKILAEEIRNLLDLGL